VQAIIAKFGAEIYSDSAPGDWSFAIMAPTFIGSFGTYSWLLALLSEGTSIHLPYVSTLPGGTDWLPWSSLFIHDDRRIVYHDIANLTTFETADVVVSRNTPFAHAVRGRTNPCPGLGD
jgi:hypothetical protein